MSSSDERGNLAYEINARRREGRGDAGQILRTVAELQGNLATGLPRALRREQRPGSSARGLNSEVRGSRPWPSSSRGRGADARSADDEPARTSNRSRIAVQSSTSSTDGKTGRTASERRSSGGETHKSPIGAGPRSGSVELAGTVAPLRRQSISDAAQPISSSEIGWRSPPQSHHHELEYFYSERMRLGRRKPNIHGLLATRLRRRTHGRQPDDE